VTALLLLSLSGCNFLIERDHLFQRPHETELSSHLNPGDFITVSTQEDLEQAIRYMVGNHVERGLLRIGRFDAGGVEAAVLKAVQEIGLDPLVDYAVSMFSHQILSEIHGHGYVELEFSIAYQRTQGQVADVRTVYSEAIAASHLERLLREGGTYLAMLCPVHVANVGFFERTIQNFYYSQALEIVTLPQVQINLSPSAGGSGQRVASIELNFGFDHSILTQMRADLHRAVEDLTRDMPDLTTGEQLIWLAEALAAHVSPNTGFVQNPPINLTRPHPIISTAYGALVERQATSEGFAMAFRALLDLLRIHSYVVLGELDGFRHAWNIVRIHGEYYHFDISRLAQYGAESTLFLSEVIMLELGYSWDLSLYPRSLGELSYSDFVIEQ